MTKEIEEKILAMVDAQTKYKTKEELLVAIREHLIKNLVNNSKDVKSR